MQNNLRDIQFGEVNVGDILAPRDRNFRDPVLIVFMEGADDADIEYYGLSVLCQHLIRLNHNELNEFYGIIPEFVPLCVSITPHLKRWAQEQWGK